MMATALVYGSVQEYNQESELFSAYLERVNLFFSANDLEDDNIPDGCGKQDLLLTEVFGGSFSSTRKDLCRVVGSPQGPL